MSNSNIPMYEFPLPLRSDYCVITIYKAKSHKTCIVMTPINEEEEQKIDNLKNGFIRLERGNKTFTVTAHQVFCYGEVDFNSEEDLDTIESFKFLNHLEFAGLKVRSRYNYETHTCKSPYKYPLWTETWSSSLASKIAHATLNKPKRILLFKTELI